MLAIAISEDFGLVYEGNGFHGHAVWPAPVVTQATVVNTEVGAANIPPTNFLGTAKLLFREDSFDPVTRIRRGRLYNNPGTQPQDWKVQPRPAHPGDQRFANSGGWVPKRLYGFYQWAAFTELSGQKGKALVALGTMQAYTLWRVIDIERIVTGEDLVTLRARIALGALPELNEKAIPENDRARVVEVVEKLADGAHRAGSESVVDLARSAAQWCLGVHLASTQNGPKLKQADLGELAKKVSGEVKGNLGLLLARLHSRAKPNEQERYDTRPILESDAELALAAVGMLLREIGWAI